MLLPKKSESAKTGVVKAPNINEGALSLDDMLSMADDIDNASAELDDFVIGSSAAGSSDSQKSPIQDLSGLNTTSSIQSSPLVNQPLKTDRTNTGSSSANASPRNGEQDESKRSGRIRRRSSGVNKAPELDKDSSGNSTNRRRRRRSQSNAESDSNAEFRKAVKLALKKASQKLDNDEADLKKAAKKIPKLEKILEKNAGDDTKPAIDATRNALNELGETRHASAIPIITQFIQDKRPSISEFAVKSLGKTKQPDALEPILNRLSAIPPESSAPYISAAGELGDRRAVHPLIIFGLENPQMSRRITDALVSIGAAGVPGLIEIADKDDAGEVLSAIIALGQIKDKRGLDSIVRILKSDMATLRCHAAEALGEMADSKSIKHLITALEDPDPNVRANVAAALAKVPDERCVAPLVKALNDSNQQVQIYAATALGDCGDPKASTPLMKILDKDDPNLLIAACESLGKLGVKKAVPRICEFLVLPEEGDDTTILVKALDTLRKLRTADAVPPLLEILPAQDPLIRQRAIEALGQAGDKSVAETLEQILAEDKSEDVRAAAAKALGELGDPESIAALEESLHDTFNIRVKSVIALGAIKNESAVPTLTSLLRDQLPEIRYHAALSLADIGHTKSIHQIEPLAADSSTMVSRGALKALKKLGDERQEKDILKAAKKRVGGAKSGGRSITFDPRDFLPESIMLILWPDDPRQRTITYSSIGGVAVVLLVAAYFLFAPPANSLPRGSTSCLAFSPDSKFIAAGRSKGRLEIWAADPSRKTRPMDSIDVALGTITSVAYTDDKTVWATLNNDLYVVENGTPTLLTSFQERVSELRTSQDRSRIAVFDDGGGVAIYDTQQKQGVGAVGLPKGVVTARGISPDGKFVIGGQADGKVTIFDLKGAEVKSFQTESNPVRAVAMSPDGKQLYAGMDNSKLYVFNVESGEVIFSKAPEFGGKGPVVDIVLSADGKELVMNCRLVVAFNVEKHEFTKLPGSSVVGFSVSPDGTYAALMIDEESFIELVDLKSKKTLAELNVPPTR